MTIDFDTRLGRAIGDSSARHLEKAFGHRTVGDLLRHYPRRYVDLAHPGSVEDIVPGQLVAIVATVLKVEKRSFANDRRKFRTHVTFQYGDSELDAVFFNQHWVHRVVQVGSQQLLSGVVGDYHGRPQLTHPRMNELPEGKTLADTRMGRGVLPIYPATKSVTTWEIEEAVGHLLIVVDQYPELLDDGTRLDRALMDSATAFEKIHQPRSRADWSEARRRFTFEEAFELQAVFAERRRRVRDDVTIGRPGRAGGLHDAFHERLPFTLTRGQEAVVQEIATDLAARHPMHRLLQGDVGSGKTIVALLAMLQVVDSGAQTALLAPTEVLAVQHHRSISAMLGDLARRGMLDGAENATRVHLLTGSMKAAERREVLLDIASGEAGIVVGTHALLQESVQFAELGLVVVDEQHRFGVEQRAVLADRSGGQVHTLVMTATPIPRTIAMTVFGDLDVSTLTELPAGRQSISTVVVPMKEQPAWFHRAWQRMREEVEQGHQAYVVVSRIGEDDSSESPTSSLLDVEARLRDGPLQGLRLGVLHGRMAAEDKDATMTAFAAGGLDVLVATTVIEVGVDVPRATMMVVFDADRFGVSQLHQLRGRVGRGNEPGLCILLTTAETDSAARERLDAVAATTDGFALSKLDVELRHEGDVLGARQSGVRSSLRLLSVVRDEETIADARDAATAVIEFGTVNEDLREAMARLEDSERADYMERA